MKYRADPLLPNSRHQSMKLLLNPTRKRRPRRKAGQRAALGIVKNIAKLLGWNVSDASAS